MPIREDWLDLVSEDTLEPELAICDPHHHLWDRPISRYLLDELLVDTGSGHNIRSTVFVECLSMYRQSATTAIQPIGETEFVQGIAAQSASGQYGETEVAAAIISFADLLLGSRVEAVLVGHMEASPNRFRGIRHACSWDSSDAVRNSHTKPPQHLYLSDTFREGFSLLKKHDLVFDAWLYHTQHTELVSLAKAFPEQLIILDHVGGPLGIGPYKGRRDEIFEEWKTSISELALCPNIVIKLGGLSMAINGFEWHKREKPPGSVELADAISPYILHCIDAFGVNRCMFESNFPVDKVSCSYNVLWNAFKRIVTSHTANEKAALFHDTAVRTYSVATEPSDST